MERLLSWVRALRRRAAGWSIADDRQFHDALFARLPHDPFSPSYPGQITIRRFADHADPYVAASSSVLDLGCGPAEITCELARRYPAVRFHAVDHSSAAIAQAQALATRLALANISFETADVSHYTPRQRVDLIVMFDAFHHLVAPRDVVLTLAQWTDRFLLIEPAGDALGRWRRTLDFDWVVSELDKIRMRIEHQLGRRSAPAAPAAPEDESAGRAIENRYATSDFEAFFAGFGVEFTGTAAGLDVYPPDPYLATPLRPRAMEMAYELLRDIDEEMRREAIDLYAKHWIVYADRRLASAPRRSERPAVEPPAASEREVTGAWDCEVREIEVPSELSAGTDVLLPLTIVNKSWRTWSSAAEPAINVSYHWLDRRRAPIAYDGLRTPLPRGVAPQDSVRGTVRVATPAVPGHYILQIDLVEEGVTWFSRAGVPPYEAGVRVR